MSSFMFCVTGSYSFSHASLSGVILCCGTGICTNTHPTQCSAGWPAYFYDTHHVCSTDLALRHCPTRLESTLCIGYDVLSVGKWR